MAVTVRIPTTMRPLSGGANTVDVDSGTLGEVIEIPGHPFFIAVQFHPEFQSKPTAPHPLFKGFIAAALENRR